MTNTQIIVVTGATGLIGNRFVSLLLELGHKVHLVTRRPERVRPAARQYIFGWNGIEIPDEALRGIDAAVHLAGRPVFGSFPGSRHRELIYESRVHSTRTLVDQIGALEQHQRPKVLICGSATGYYGSRGETPLTEDTEPGDSFLATVCRDWEEEAKRIETFGVRWVSLRTGVVLARSGGALPMMSLPFRLGFGGRLGHGRQWFPWIHLEDLCALLIAILDDELYQGPINAVAPTPTRNVDFTRKLAHVLHRPAFIPVPPFLIRLCLGPLAGELLGSRYVIPARAQRLGFSYLYPEIGGALAETAHR